MGKTRRLMPLVLIFTLLLALMEPGRASAAGTAGTVVGYYAAWASGQGYTPDQLPAELFTQINYAFAKIQDGKLALSAPEQDRKNLQGLTALRKRNPKLKIVLSVGGWDESTYFSDAAVSPASRAAFAQSCAELILEHRLDGIDLDWEYPVSGGAAGVIHRPQDKENFTLLLQALRDALDRQGRQNGKQYVLSIAGAADGSYLNAIEPQAAAEIVDHIFIMAYDFNGPWDIYTGFNAPLYTPSGGPNRYRSSVDCSVSAWLRHGVPAGKLVLGMPLYGYIYQGVSHGSYGLYGLFNSAKSLSWDKLKEEYLNNSSYQQFRHSEADVPYLYGNQNFISYDDENSIAHKGELARRYGLGGIGFWELSQDQDGDLLQSAWAAWNSGRFQDVPPDAWYAGAVERISAAGLMRGTGAGQFSPNKTVTRGQITAILHRLSGAPAASHIPFSDVSASDYYGEAAAWAAEQGVVGGFPDGTFRPNLPVSRQQLAAILWRYALLEQADSGKRASLEDYQDTGEISGYAMEPLSWALAEGILGGTKEKRLLPQGSASRAQTAVILDRFSALLETA